MDHASPHAGPTGTTQPAPAGGARNRRTHAVQVPGTRQGRTDVASDDHAARRSGRSVEGQAVAAAARDTGLAEAGDRAPAKSGPGDRAPATSSPGDRAPAKSGKRGGSRQRGGEPEMRAVTAVVT